MADETALRSSQAKATSFLHEIDIDHWLPFGSPEFIKYGLLSLLLVVFGGIMSGLQQGITKIELTDIVRSENYAKGSSKVEGYLNRLLADLVRKRHLTLVTLLFANAIAMEALPIFLDVLVPSYVAIFLSVTLLLLFGEIIPQAVTLRWPKEVSLIFAPLVWLLVCLLSPVSYPIAKLLDLFLGRDHFKLLNRQDITELLHIHSQENSGPLTKDEIEVMTGALCLSEKSAIDVMVPLEEVFMISFEDVLDEEKLSAILNAGHSRVPVYKEKRENIIGVLLTRSLARVDPRNKIPIFKLQILPIWTVPPEIPLYTMLRKFRTTGISHMAAVGEILDASILQNQANRSREDSVNMVVSDRKNPSIKAFGILTLEDVIEALLQGDIIDETDGWEHAKSSLDQRLSKVRTLRADLVQMLESDTKKFEAPTSKSRLSPFSSYYRRIGGSHSEKGSSESLVEPNASYGSFSLTA